MFKGYGELSAVSSSLSPLFIPVQASEVLKPQEKEGSLLISKAATFVETVVGGGKASRRALLVKQRHRSGQRRRMRGAGGEGDGRRLILLEGDRDGELSGIRMNREGEML